MDVHARDMKALWCFLPLFVAAGCGGKAVVDPGAGGATSTTSSTTTSSGVCASHDDCPGGVCILRTGQCAAACDNYCDPCAPGTVCDQCATSSCPKCDDCRGGCVPKVSGQCDDNDPCGSSLVCIWAEQRCAPSCTDGSCADASMVCAQCATGSCCACKDCVDVCIDAN